MREGREVPAENIRGLVDAAAGVKSRPARRAAAPAGAGISTGNPDDRPTLDAQLSNGWTLTVREPSAHETIRLARCLGSESDIALINAFFGMAMSIIAINGTATLRNTRLELEGLLSSFGTKSLLEEATVVVGQTLSILRGEESLEPQDGETTEAFQARREVASRENLSE